MATIQAIPEVAVSLKTLFSSGGCKTNNRRTL
jgi:hypothetical protein